VEVVGWTEVVEVVVLTGEVVVVELPWVVIAMDCLQQSEVAWYLLRVGQWPREVDLKEHKVLMVTLLLIINRGQSGVVNDLSL
jgi:glucose-6-phosphate-specific signal transduction histidine kinase